LYAKQQRLPVLLITKQQLMLKSAPHCYGSHLHFVLGAKANTQSLILLFSPSLPGERWRCNLHRLYKASLDKMKTLRENAYAKCDPSSISEPVFQLWEERVSVLWGSDIQPTPLVHVTVHWASRSPPERLALAGSTL